jgi:hypothetical protein
MRFNAIAALAVIGGLAASVSPASAQSLRCKNDLASVGDSRASVLLKCGEPVLKDSFCKPVATQPTPAPAPGGTTINVVPCETVDEWTYKPGYGQFVTTLRFEEGTLRAIKYGDRIK